MLKDITTALTIYKYTKLKQHLYTLKIYSEKTLEHI